MEAMFPNALWILSRDQAAEYAIPKSRRLIQPQDTLGLPKTRQWALDTVADEIVVFLDDDIQFLFCNVGLVGRRIYNAARITQVMENTIELARGFETSLFGFAPHGDVRKYNPGRPFNLTGWIGTALGIIGRKYRFAAQQMVSRGDIDFSLRVIEGDRIVMRDDRFAFVSNRFTGAGGASGLRTSETDRADLHYLKKEWGRYIEFIEKKTGISPSIHVVREQRLEL